MHPPDTRCTAFLDGSRLAAGELRHVALKARQAQERAPAARVLVFDDHTGEAIALPLQAPMPELVRLLGGGLPAGGGDRPPRPRTRGRPRLGVTAREVTLLPRHWDWLAAQPGGASEALRRLVDEAGDARALADPRRAAQAAAHRFLGVIGEGRADLPDTLRALFAPDRGRFEELLQAWSEDVREHALLLAAAAFSD